MTASGSFLAIVASECYGGVGSRMLVGQVIRHVSTRIRKAVVPSHRSRFRQLCPTAPDLPDEQTSCVRSASYGHELRLIDWRERVGALIGDSYVLHIFILVFIWCIVIASWDLILGYAGIFNYAQLVFFAVGAYGPFACRQTADGRSYPRSCGGEEH